MCVFSKLSKAKYFLFLNSMFFPPPPPPLPLNGTVIKKITFFAASLRNPFFAHPGVHPLSAKKKRFCSTEEEKNNVLKRNHIFRNFYRCISLNFFLPEILHFIPRFHFVRAPLLLQGETELSFRLTPSLTRSYTKPRTK